MYLVVKGRTQTKRIKRKGNKTMSLQKSVSKHLENLGVEKFFCDRVAKELINTMKQAIENDDLDSAYNLAERISYNYNVDQYDMIDTVKELFQAV